MNNTITKFSFAAGTSLLMLVLGLLYGVTSVSAQVATTTGSTATSTSATATTTSSTTTGTATTSSATATTTGTITITPITISAPITINFGSLIPLCEIQRSLRIGSRGEDVRCLQKFLNFSGYTVATFGAGSLGNETTYFGNATANAVMRWQNANSTSVLSPAGLTSGTGNFGPLSFNHYASLVRNSLGVSAL